MLFVFPLFCVLACVCRDVHMLSSSQLLNPTIFLEIILEYPTGFQQLLVNRSRSTAMKTTEAGGLVHMFTKGVLHIKP